MKKFLCSLVALLCLSLFTYAVTDDPAEGMELLKTLNIKAHKKFAARFESAESVRAHQENGNTHVSFRIGGLQMRIVYNSYGKQQYMITYYPADSLPGHIGEFVTEEFRNCRILNATRVQKGIHEIFLVNIVHKKKLKTIRIKDDRFEVYREYDYSE